MSFNVNLFNFLFTLLTKNEYVEDMFVYWFFVMIQRFSIHSL
jgi:hypothetical protein